MNQCINILFLFIYLCSFSQSKKELERKRKKLNKEIKRIEAILSETNRDKSNTLEDLRDFNKKVEIREQLIQTIEKENEELSKDIDNNQKKIANNNSDLENLKTDYAQMVYKSFKSKSQQSQTMFLLSSKNFIQAYKRLKYMEQYKNFRRKQAKTIIKKTKLIEQLNDSLIKAKATKEKLILSKKNENEKIKKDLKEQKRLLKNIKLKEKKFESQLREKLTQEKKVSDKIEKIIRDAITTANKGKKTKSKELVLSSEENRLKTRFEQNKGKLPPPVQEGFITRKFGIQPHPRFKKIKINSAGIRIRCKKGYNAFAVFNGKVLSVQVLSKGQKSVLIQHGDYITTYTNLEKVYVNKGDKVKTGDKLGRIFTNKITNKTFLQFILSKNTKKLDPEKWLNL